MEISANQIFMRPLNPLFRGGGLVHNQILLNFRNDEFHKFAVLYSCFVSPQ